MNIKFCKNLQYLIKPYHDLNKLVKVGLLAGLRFSIYCIFQQKRMYFHNLALALALRCGVHLVPADAGLFLTFRFSDRFSSCSNTFLPIPAIRFSA